MSEPSEETSTIVIGSEDELCARLAQPGPRVSFRAGGSKSPRLAPSGAASRPEHVLDLRALRGITYYEPDEYVISERAATPISELVAALDAHGQYFPFDPLLVDSALLRPSLRSATIGGTVAANSSGPGRYRHGGVRDFVIGVSLVDGVGRLIKGGGRVVKNAAGFDLAKMMVGSLGSLGCLVDVTLKVFPRPRASATVVVHQLDRQRALGSLQSLQGTSFDVAAVDLLCTDGIGADRSTESLWTVAIRLIGPERGLASRVESLQAWARARSVSEHDVESLAGAAEAGFWRRLSNLDWSSGTDCVVKVPVTMESFEHAEHLGTFSGFERVFSSTQQVWLSVPPDGELATLDRALGQLGLVGQVIRQPTAKGVGASQTLLGRRRRNPFAERVKAVFDPNDRLQPLFISQ